MKKRISYLIVSVMLLTLFTGCENTNSHSNKIVKILFSYTPEENYNFRDTIADNAKAYAESVGVQLDIEDNEGSIEKQVETFKEAEQKGYNAIICIAEDIDTARQLIAAAGTLPIVFVSNKPDDDILEKDKYIYVGSSEEVAGQYQAEYILEKLSAKDEINVVLLKGLRGHSATIGRTNMLIETLRKSEKKVNIIFNDFADFSKEIAYSRLNVFLSTGQKVDVIACNSDAMAIGAIKALKDKNVDLSTIEILGVDATSEALDAVVAGEMEFTVYQSATGQGEYSARVAIALATNGKSENIDYISEDGKNIWIPFEKVDKNNAKEYLK